MLTQRSQSLSHRERLDLVAGDLLNNAVVILRAQEQV